MITSRWITAAAVALALGGSVLLFADEPRPDAAAQDEAAAPAAAAEAAAAPDAGAEAAPAGDPAVAAAKAAGEDTQKKAAKVRLTKPWRDMASLNDEQRAQIAAIHRKAVQEIKAIERREREEIMALLNDEQKSELQALVEKNTLQRKAKKPAAAAAPADESAAGAAEQ